MKNIKIKNAGISTCLYYILSFQIYSATTVVSTAIVSATTESTAVLSTSTVSTFVLSASVAVPAPHPLQDETEKPNIIAKIKAKIVFFILRSVIFKLIKKFVKRIIK